jgi:hypothetical protein
MGFDLTSNSGEAYQLRTHAWTLLLYIAEAYGWKQQGTLAPEGVRSGEWDGGYATNDGQFISAEDAAELAAAWERMLADPRRVDKVIEIANVIDRDLRMVAKRDHGIDLPESPVTEYPIEDGWVPDVIRFFRSGKIKLE